MDLMKEMTDISDRRDTMDWTIYLRRFMIPAPLISILYFIKYRCQISIKAEVEWSPNLKIGRNTKISSFTKIKATYGPLNIGDNVSIGAGCKISVGPKGVLIGDDCLLSPNVIIVGGNYRYDQLDIPIRKQKHVSKGTTIMSNVWIGAGSCILDGSTIGSGSIITPNSVVSGNIPDNSIVQGIPAKVIFVRR